MKDNLILEKIIQNKQKEIEQKKQNIPWNILEKRQFFSFPTKSLKNALIASKTGFICEFKRKSPSKGFFHSNIKAEDVVFEYEKAGASGISILTDETFFAGKNEDILEIRKKLQIPILRKEFILEEYQILESKSLGADVILLISECLTKQQIQKFTDFAHSLHLEVLLELHSKEELPKIYDKIDFLGINNRNLKTFSTNIENSIHMYPFLPKEIIKISESGLSRIESIKRLQEIGYKGFLIGENFMKEEKPGQKCREFIQNFEKMIR